MKASKVYEISYMMQLSFSDIEYTNRRKKTKREEFWTPWMKSFFGVIGLVLSSCTITAISVDVNQSALRLYLACASCKNNSISPMKEWRKPSMTGMPWETSPKYTSWRTGVGCGNPAEMPASFGDTQHQIKIFQDGNGHFEKTDLIIHGGLIFDVTIITASRST